MKEDKIGSACGTHAEKNAYRILAQSTGGKRQLRRHRQEDIIKIGIRKIGWDGMVWIDLAEDKDHRRALVNAVINLRVP
jgi:hypothetical protein